MDVINWPDCFRSMHGCVQQNSILCWSFEFVAQEFWIFACVFVCVCGGGVIKKSTANFLGKWVVSVRICYNIESVCWVFVRMTFELTDSLAFREIIICMLYGYKKLQIACYMECAYFTLKWQSYWTYFQNMCIVTCHFSRKIKSIALLSKWFWYCCPGI